ncbi:hypothetical protein ABE41_006515 [Fictibacillus arsenicus]|uniref:DUF4145 domain-containing protein n=1 Tax=Fictibacillus arsenicus TaxID=255247 RepID=A0A1B1Z2E3_9BACL|nr:DUF4145 domain-containing protein [Fictibacillus arsenicus]ANX11655.1 hypothetical protein ABE41_006515 [Fictibacillus arsenicus]
MNKLEEKVYCNVCKGARNHHILKTYSEVADYHSDIHWHAKYHIVQCLGCDTIAFVEQYGDEDTWDYNEYTGEREWKDIFKVFPEEPPKPSKDDFFLGDYKLKIKNFNHVDPELKELYSQIVQVFNQRFNILCAAGLRTLIEAICLKTNITGGRLYDEDKKVKISKKGNEVYSTSLEGKIYGLYDKQLILWDQCRILQEIRDIGNSAVHEIEIPCIKTLRPAIIIVEGIFESIYELREKSLVKK